MAENVREIQPPEPPPRPPEVPKPTEQSDGSETHTQPMESQQSAREEMRRAARSEHAGATSAADAEGLRPMESATAPEFDRAGQPPTGEQYREAAAVNRSAAAERAGATADTNMLDGPGGPQPVQDVTPQSEPLLETKPPLLDNQTKVLRTEALPGQAEDRNDQRPNLEERGSPAEHGDATAPTDIADEIASSPVDVRMKPHVNSAGETVDRYIIDDVDDLLPLAEHLGLGELSHDKDDYYSGQLPDGRYRKIEWNLQGHPETNEGPHVKVMETVDPWSSPSKGGNRWKTRAMIFVDGHEQFKKQWH